MDANGGINVSLCNGGRKSTQSEGFWRLVVIRRCLAIKRRCLLSNGGQLWMKGEFQRRHQWR